MKYVPQKLILHKDNAKFLPSKLCCSYHQLVTPYIYTQIERQYKLCAEVPIELTATGEGVFQSQSGYTVTTDCCSCSFFKTMILPCRHIFKLLKNEKLNMFKPTLCSNRWTKQYYQQSHPALSAYDRIPQSQPVFAHTIKSRDEVSKFKKAATVTKELNNRASTLTGAEYDVFMEKVAAFANTMLNPDIPVPSTSRSVVSGGSTPSVNGERNYPITPASSSANPAAGRSGSSDVTEAESSTVDSAKNLRNDIAAFKLPPKMKCPGRPKEKVNTVAGVKRKGDAAPGVTPVKKKFIDLNSQSQSINIIRWLTNKTAKQICAKRVAKHEIIEDQLIFNRLRNDMLDFSGTKKYFESKAYKYLREEIQKLNNKIWPCGKCLRKLSGNQIMCVTCLDWFHVQCAEFEGDEDFYCSDCSNNANLVEIN